MIYIQSRTTRPVVQFTQYLEDTILFSACVRRRIKSVEAENLNPLNISHGQIVAVPNSTDLKCVPRNKNRYESLWISGLLPGNLTFSRSVQQFRHQW